MFEKIVLQKGALKVTQVNTKETKRGRPTPMNTVEMLKAASKVLGIGPKECMHAAENLYLMGYLSYPRTESTAWTPPASSTILMFLGLLASLASAGDCTSGVTCPSPPEGAAATRQPAQ